MSAQDGLIPAELTPYFSIPSSLCIINSDRICISQKLLQ